MATLEAETTQRKQSPGAWGTEGPGDRVTWYLRPLFPKKRNEHPVLAHTIITSTAHVSSVSPPSYRNTIFDQSVHIFS